MPPCGRAPASCLWICKRVAWPKQMHVVLREGTRLAAAASMPSSCHVELQVGVIDTGIALGHEDLQHNVNKKCEDFVNGDHTCDEGKFKGPSKGEQRCVASASRPTQCVRPV